MSIKRVDSYIKNLPGYWKRSVTMQAEKSYQIQLDHHYKWTVIDFDKQRNPPVIKECKDGTPATWLYIDFDPYEAWLGRRHRSLLDMEVETWECDDAMWKYPYCPETQRKINKEAEDA